MFQENDSFGRYPSEGPFFFHGWGFEPPWFFKKQMVRRQSPEATGMLRAQFRSVIRDAFRIKALASLGEEISEEQFSSRWGVHHIVPLGLGGHNDTLALVHMTPHGEIHKFIDEQLDGLKTGEARSIWIPRHPGLVWGYTFPFRPAPHSKKKRARVDRISDDFFLLANQKSAQFMELPAPVRVELYRVSSPQFVCAVG